jgi:hypothetical protein
MRRLHRFAFTPDGSHVTFDPSHAILAAPQPEGNLTMTKTEKPAPREISATEMKQASGGRGLLIVCVEHKGQLICQMI